MKEQFEKGELATILKVHNAIPLVISFILFVVIAVNLIQAVGQQYRKIDEQTTAISEQRQALLQMDKVVRNLQDKVATMGATATPTTKPPSTPTPTKKP